MKKEALQALSSIPQREVSKELHNFGIDLMRKMVNDEITKEEFYKETTYFALQCGFDELRLRPLPTKPKELIEYEFLTDRQKEKIGEDFWRETPVWVYVKQCGEIKARNYSDKKWLEELLERFESYGDNICVEKVKSQLKTFIS